MFPKKKTSTTKNDPILNVHTFNVCKYDLKRIDFGVDVPRNSCFSRKKMIIAIL